MPQNNLSDIISHGTINIINDVVYKQVWHKFYYFHKSKKKSEISM